MDENVAMSANKENEALKVQINDLKTSYAMMQVEYEELEIKNQTLQRDVVNHDDKMEEAYCEGRKIKDSLNNSIIEKNKLIKDLEDKDIQISNIKKELAKTRSKFKDLENVNNENEENIIMLENKLASRDQKVYELHEEIKTIEATAPITFSTCVECSF